MNGTYGDYLYAGRAVDVINSHNDSQVRLATICFSFRSPTMHRAAKFVVIVCDVSTPSQPLFYYLALQCAHDPMEVPDRFAALFDKETCPSQIEYVMQSLPFTKWGSLLIRDVFCAGTEAAGYKIRLES